MHRSDGAPNPPHGVSSIRTIAVWQRPGAPVRGHTSRVTAAQSPGDVPRPSCSYSPPFARAPPSIPEWVPTSPIGWGNGQGAPGERVGSVAPCTPVPGIRLCPAGAGPGPDTLPRDELRARRHGRNGKVKRGGSFVSEEGGDCDPARPASRWTFRSTHEPARGYRGAKRRRWPDHDDSGARTPPGGDPWRWERSTAIVDRAAPGRGRWTGRRRGSCRLEWRCLTCEELTLRRRTIPPPFRRSGTPPAGNDPPEHIEYLACRVARRCQILARRSGTLLRADSPREIVAICYVAQARTEASGRVGVPPDDAVVRHDTSWQGPHRESRCIVGRPCSRRPATRP
jgi:hypothetical protein